MHPDKPSNYLITYTVKNKRGDVIKSGKIRAKNKFSDFEAKAGLERHLRKTITDFHTLIIHSCGSEDLFVSIGEILEFLKRK